MEDSLCSKNHKNRKNRKNDEWDARQVRRDTPAARDILATTHVKPNSVLAIIG